MIEGLCVCSSGIVVFEIIIGGERKILYINGKTEQKFMYVRTSVSY